MPKDPTVEIGQRLKLSAIDVERVQILYGCIKAVSGLLHNLYVHFPASTRRGTHVIFMLVGHVEITWGNMWKCLVFSTADFPSQAQTPKHVSNPQLTATRLT